jgi:hypothetical protein
MRFLEDLLQLLLEFSNRLRRLGRVVFFVLCKTSSGEQAEKHEPSYGFHGWHSALEMPGTASR